MTSMIFVSPMKKDFHPSIEEFSTAATKRWAPHVEVRPHPTSLGGVIARIERPEESFFQVWLPAKREFISTDGVPEQVLEVAQFMLELVPGLPLWIVDQGYSGHVVVRPDMSVSDIETKWVIHDENFEDPFVDNRPLLSAERERQWQKSTSIRDSVESRS